MRIISFNINSIRARLHQLEAITQRWAPDILCLQETKVHDDQFPREAVEALGYNVVFNGQKGHYGVATLFRDSGQAVAARFPEEEDTAQRRLLITRHELPGRSVPLTVINGYFPQGENRNHPDKFPLKVAYYRNLLNWLQANHTPEDSIVVLGDFNVAPEDTDIGIGDPNRKRWLREGKCAFLPEEREWIAELKAWGLQDSFRLHHSQRNDRFSWFDYRSRGFEDDPRRGLRIDHLMVTAPLAKACTGSDIDYDTRAMDKPSDHAPVWGDYDL
ncbi:MAG: exodeoxyribonuclease III [Natronospirillum sp.]|uniref:exodeoxyribonuclease III n=1 Tax=Natronospirillum sp. TaxID=2812955 RepID=UPI0025F89ADA|nr:exodeoxyribonuclease III [Natronospirillum sp.]MCH8552385.1 exodeoxyribonuclease III [Natronospirillum sp.]